MGMVGWCGEEGRAQCALRCYVSIKSGLYRDRKMISKRPTGRLGHRMGMVGCCSEEGRDRVFYCFLMLIW